MPPLREIRVAGQRMIDGLAFPLAFGPPPGHALKNGADTAAYVQHHAEEISRLMSKHGAIRFEGFPTPTAEDFNAVVAALGRRNFKYVGGAAPRNQVRQNPFVFTSNESPSDKLIPPHHELVLYTKDKVPRVIGFHCEVAPTSRGETPLVHSHELFREIERVDPVFIQQLRARGVRYARVAPFETDKNSPIGRSWRETLNADTREEAEKVQASLGGHIEWQPDGSAKLVSAVLPGLGEHEGKETFYNAVIAIYAGWKDARNDPRTAATFGDGSPLPAESVQRAHEIALAISAKLRWRRGSFDLIDNDAVMHSRRTFRGERRINAALLGDRI